jgi:hypothetical protein
MMTLNYTITFLDYWHMGSGLSAGAKFDAKVIKDNDGIAFVPGKTFKGLAREMAELIGDTAFVQTCFGEEGVKMGACYFSDAIVSPEMHAQIVSNQLQDHLYDEIASTKIDSNGLAADGSLREIEVVIPLTLHGEVRDIPQEHGVSMKQTLNMIKRMGLNRNRGLGRCVISVEEKS